MTRPTCGVKGPGGRVCGAVLRERIARFGQLAWDCPRCERRKAGICADCPRPVVGTVGKAERCAEHRRLALRENDRDYAVRDPQRARRQSRDGMNRHRVRIRHGAPPLSCRESGRRAGLARAAALTPEQRRAIAGKAGRARWARQRMAA